MFSCLPCRAILSVRVRSQRRATIQAQTQTQTQTRTYSDSFNFGKMVNAKATKDPGTAKKNVEDSYWSAASEDELRRREQLSNDRLRRAAELEAKVEEEPAPEPEPAAEASAEEGAAPKKVKKSRIQDKGFAVEFNQFINKEREEYDLATAEANDPCFSVRAQQAAWQMHKSDPVKWNADRLANMFRVKLDVMRISLWASKVEDQAEKEGFAIDDSVERAFEQIYGAYDFPDSLSDVPERIRYKNARNAWFFIDDEISSGAALKSLKSRDLAHMRESPRLPKQPLPPVKPVHQKVPSVGKVKIHSGRYGGKFYLWDISKSKNMYNRRIVVREEDGSMRTGNWQERRWAEDYRRFLKYPVVSPVPTPDETQRDDVPAHARADAAEIDSLERILEEAENILQARRQKYWSEIMTRDKFDGLIEKMKLDVPLSVPFDHYDYDMAVEAATAPHESGAEELEMDEEDLEDDEEANE